MALFLFWRDGATPDADLVHSRIEQEAHIVAERRIDLGFSTPAGRWRLTSFATASRFYTAEAQVWVDTSTKEACVIHGVIWSFEAGRARLLDAADVARRLDRPGGGDIAALGGEFAIARLHRCGTIEAFSDPAGLHHLFHRRGSGGAIANRAAFAAAAFGERQPDPEAGMWCTTIGYRASAASGWRGVRQLAPGERWTSTGVKPAAKLQSGAIEARGFHPNLAEAGIAEAIVLLRAATDGDERISLPITGGKDSRAVLALCLAAGLRNRLDLFTRGDPTHPDVRAGEAIAARLGVPHRTEPPLGANETTDWNTGRFAAEMGRLAFQTDGGMGGWDRVTGIAAGRETIITGHMGELLKAYAKRPLADPSDPIALVRAQGPFDPLGIVHAHAKDAMRDQIAGLCTTWLADGATPADLPDLFYRYNRVPNWLGGIRGIKSFERQPVMPLGVPSLMRLAAVMTAQDRAEERAHFHIVSTRAPMLLDLPFAHQHWLTPGAPASAPFLAPVHTKLFGNWQYSLNRNPELRPQLARLFETSDVALWDVIDRNKVLSHLRDQALDYFGCISILGLIVAVLHGAGLVRRDRIGGAWNEAVESWVEPAGAPAMIGHLDGWTGAAEAVGPSSIRPGRAGSVDFGGWLVARGWDGAQPRVEAWVDDHLVATTGADQPRPDLNTAGIARGNHGFTLRVDAAQLAGGRRLRVTGHGGEGDIGGGTLAVVA